jgi:hypothetical protein
MSDLLRFSDVFPLAVPPRHPQRLSLQSTLEGLQELHALPLMKSIGVRTEPMKVSGLFDPQIASYGVRIGDLTENPCMTVAHEIAHALDYFAFGKEFVYTSELQAERGEVWDTWKLLMDATPTAQNLAEGVYTQQFPKLRELCRYYLEPRELFARSYAQYVAVKLGTAEILSELHHLQQQMPRSQWYDDEFMPVIEVFDQLLSLNGWR